MRFFEKNRRNNQEVMIITIFVSELVYRILPVKNKAAIEK
jgi:hypothetical protein